MLAQVWDSCNKPRFALHFCLFLGSLNKHNQVSPPMLSSSNKTTFTKIIPGLAIFYSIQDRSNSLHSALFRSQQIANNLDFSSRNHSKDIEVFWRKEIIKYYMRYFNKVYFLTGIHPKINIPSLNLLVQWKRTDSTRSIPVSSVISIFTSWFNTC